MRLIFIATILVAGACFAQAAPQTGRSRRHPCTAEQEKQASRDMDHLKGWRAVYRSFRRFGQCDDGEIAEGYSDAVAQLLAKRWGTLPELDGLVSADSAFKRFVLDHIDATASYDDLKAMAGNARLRCRPRQKQLCDSIARQAENAMKEIDKDTH